MGIIYILGVINLLTIAMEKMFEMFFFENFDKLDELTYPKIIFQNNFQLKLFSQDSSDK